MAKKIKTKPSTLTKVETAVIHQMRQRGFAVVYWAPEKLRGACAVDVQDEVREQGQQIIDRLHIKYSRKV